jgi:hypothetical protein
VLVEGCLEKTQTVIRAMKSVDTFEFQPRCPLPLSPLCVCLCLS